MPLSNSLVVVSLTALTVLPPAAAPGYGQSTASLHYPAAAAAGGVERGASDPSFHTPSRPPGVDYTLPLEADIVATLGRIRDHFVRTTPYQVIDTVTGARITDLAQPTAAAGIDTRPGEYNEWTYSMGVVLAGMLLASEATADPSFAAYTTRNFDFILDHLAYFRRQAEAFGPEPRSLRRLLDMRELDDCGAIGAALVKWHLLEPQARQRSIIDQVADFISRRMLRLDDGTLVRPRPRAASLWVDDAYMSVPFLAQMGRLTGERAWFDDAARQVLQMSSRLFDPARGLYDHSWFADASPDPRFFWGRGAGWMLMAMAELLSVMPDDHPDRAAVLSQFQKAAQGVAAVQGGTGAWHQLLDKPDSYLETSATAMFTFALARGVNRGWLPPTYGPIAQAGWMALATRVRPDGQIEGIVVGTTAAYDAVYYYNRPTALGAMQGYGPALMAGAEVLTMLRQFDIGRSLNTYHYSRRGSAP